MTNPEPQHRSMKDMPAQFFLPPRSNAKLRSETTKLVALSIGFIVFLAIIVALTQGIVIEL